MLAEEVVGRVTLAAAERDPHGKHDREVRNDDDDVERAQGKEAPLPCKKARDVRGPENQDQGVQAVRR